MNLTDLVTTPEALKGCYPTPGTLADKLLAGIDWNRVERVLEPSAGTGNLVKAVLSKKALSRNRYWCNEKEFFVDTVEFDPNLAAILSARFGPGSDKDDKYDFATVNLVGEDFLTFHTLTKYDLVVMNPPFTDGDAHLEKVIAMTERYGGIIRCILNAETIRNPFSVRRKMLVQKLKDLHATIDYVPDAFIDAERHTSVEVALVAINIPTPDFKSDIFERLEKAQAQEEAVVDAGDDIVANDLCSRMVAQFNLECAAGAELIRQYVAMIPHMLNEFPEVEKSAFARKPILELKLSNKKDVSVNGYLRAVRSKYWGALFANPEFMAKLTSKMQDDWRSKVLEMQEFDFSIFNIKRVINEMNGQLQMGVKDAILKMWEKMTVEHAWYADASTQHYYTGWATNKVHMIGPKVILPCGAYATCKYDGRSEFNQFEAVEKLRDLEKVLDYFDGEGIYASVDLSTVMEKLSESYRWSYDGAPIPPKNINCKHFKVSFFKKGTVHIWFHSQKLVDRFNIYIGLNKGELPPNYGRTAYADLSEREKEVVDSFNGTGAAGSGEEAYTKVYENQALYLSAPKGTGTMLALGN